MASPAVLADLARKAPHSPLAKRLFAAKEAPATSASTLTEVISYGTAAKDAAVSYDDSTPSDREIGRQQMQHVPKDVIDRLDANEQRQAEMHEQLLQQGRLLNDLLASQASMSTMIAQLKPSFATSAVLAPAQAQHQYQYQHQHQHQHRHNRGLLPQSPANRDSQHRGQLPQRAPVTLFV